MEGNDAMEIAEQPAVPATHRPVARPALRPGPGLPAAVGWLLLLLVWQTAFAVAAVVAFGQQPVALVAVVAFSTLLLAVVLSGCFLGSALREKLAFRVPDVPHVLLALMVSTPLVVVVSEWSAWLVDAWRACGLPLAVVDQLAFREVVDDFGRHPLPFRVAASVVFISLFPAVGEELFFRGFLGSGLVARWGLARGVLLTAALFGAMHLNPLHAGATVVLGVALHLVYLWSRSILVPMLLHFAYNGQCCVVAAISQVGQWDASQDTHVPPALALVAFAAAAGILYVSRQSRVRWVREDGSEWSPWFPSAGMPPAGVAAVSVPGRPRAAGVFAAVVLYLIFCTFLAEELLAGGAG
jgi:membrane protease YdiL (CAAX protease family)